MYYYILSSHKNENFSEEQDRSYLDPKLADLKQPRKVSSLEIVNSKAFKNSTIITSLKIFKHYKLEPKFSIIKDDKAKDLADPTPKFW